MLSINLSICVRDYLSIFLEHIGNCSSCLVEETTDSTLIRNSLSWNIRVKSRFWLIGNGILEIRVSYCFWLIDYCRLRCLRRFRIRFRVIRLILAKYVLQHIS